jgi:hypothetical protein
MFDSPIAACPVCRQMVLLDQTRAECAREHRCRRNCACPLANFFTGIDFSVPQPKDIVNDPGCRTP